MIFLGGGTAAAAGRRCRPSAARPTPRSPPSGSWPAAATCALRRQRHPADRDLADTFTAVRRPQHQPAADIDAGRLDRTGRRGRVFTDVIDSVFLRLRLAGHPGRPGHRQGRPHADQPGPGPRGARPGGRAARPGPCRRPDLTAPSRPHFVQLVGAQRFLTPSAGRPSCRPTRPAIRRSSPARPSAGSARWRTPSSPAARRPGQTGLPAAAADWHDGHRPRVSSDLKRARTWTAATTSSTGPNRSPSGSSSGWPWPAASACSRSSRPSSSPSPPPGTWSASWNGCATRPSTWPPTGCPGWWSGCSTARRSTSRPRRHRWTSAATRSARSGQAFNAVQETAVRVAVEQAELRRSVRDVFLSLARRSQALLHRQLGPARRDGAPRHRRRGTRRAVPHRPPGHPHAAQRGEPHRALRRDRRPGLAQAGTDGRRAARRPGRGRGLHPGHRAAGRQRRRWSAGPSATSSTCWPN